MEPLNPTPDTILVVRLEAGLTQGQAASLIDVTVRSWQSWEQGINPMPPGLWKMFLILTDRETVECMKKAKVDGGVL